MQAARRGVKSRPFFCAQPNRDNSSECEMIDH